MFILKIQTANVPGCPDVSDPGAQSRILKMQPHPQGSLKPKAQTLAAKT